MAHHNKTPLAVLNAPTATRTWVVEYTDPNRAARRHRVNPNTGKRTFRLRLWRPWGSSAPNQPFRYTAEPNVRRS